MEYLENKNQSTGGEDKPSVLQVGTDIGQESPAKPVNPKMTSFKMYRRRPKRIEKIEIVKPQKGWNLARVNTTQRVLFLDNLSTMLMAGLSLAPALNTLKKELGNKYLEQVVGYLENCVQNGQSLSTAMKQYPKIFPEMIVATIEVGENGGRLAESASHLAGILKAQKELRRKVFSALMYPSIVLLALVGVSLFLALAVFPQLITMFEEGGVRLPFVLITVNQVSLILTNYGWYILIGLVIFIILWKVVFTLPKARYVLHVGLLKIPFVGRIISELALTRFAGNLHALLAAGLSIVKSLEIVAKTLNNLKYREETIKISKELQRGDSLDKALRIRPKLFPSLAVQLCRVGETTGELESVLQKISKFYEDKVNAVLGNLSVILEPVLLVLVGVAVGFIAVSVIGPMYELTNSFAE